jgi:hypothetical protein
MTVAQETRWRAELQIIQEIGKVPSSREMQKLLKDKCSIEANHNTVNADLKRDLEFLTKEEYTNQKNGILSMLDTEISIAHSIATNEADSELKLKAMNTVSKLSKTKSDILIKFRKAQARLSTEDKPIYNITIGKPIEIDLKKFNKLKKDVKNAEKID